MEKIQAHIVGETISSNSSEAHTLYEKSCFGEPVGDKIQYSASEALYLLEKNKLELAQKGKKLSFKELENKLKKIDSRIYLKYAVFKDLRERGYIVKTALKFGADFRVYDKGKRPGKAHAKWIVYPVEEESAITWYEFAAKTRVAHSTKKRLLIGIVDDECDVTYIEIKWTRP